MIVTIDGPAGSGKSSTAREVARRLGFLHADSGAFYRAFAFAAFERGWAGPAGLVSAEKLPALAAARVGAEPGEGGVQPTLDGRRLGAELRSPEVTLCASRISVFPEIRQRVNELLRGLASRYEGGMKGGIICEGRDMGTVVFPDAGLKIYMAAASEERARRRLLQHGEGVSKDSIRAEAARLLARDTADSKRSVSPLRKAEDALEIDTTHLSFEQQVERIVAAIRERLDTT